MNEKSLRKVEYDKIIARLAEKCRFSVSRDIAEALIPVDKVNAAECLLAETKEAREIIRLHPLFTVTGLWDIRPSMKKIKIGGILEPDALVNIASLCRGARTGKSFFSELKGSYPIIQSLGKSMVILKTIESAIERAIGPDLTINDNASERLAGIRRRSKDKAELIKERLENLIKSPATAKYLQEPIVTFRENRYVVPVRQEYRGKIAGIAHDTSSSGATVFIEPMAVLQLNNELTSLVGEEEEEVAAILKAISMVISGFANELNSNLTIMARLDFIFAKGQLGFEMDGIAPKINDNGSFRFIKARHPLIEKSKVIPIDVYLNKETIAMIITGPNTGGKTVTIKTIGLLTCMALAGLEIPAQTGSEICCYRAVWADIGDEQSIEQSLSTFSSHMSNIISILEAADQNSLVLLDELGAGTDPTEGAALAMAILKYLKERGAHIVATTHYSELKAFAYNNPGFINASMEFDVATLSPTYHLIMGAPGKSNAFEISRLLGLPEEIIKAAEEGLSTEDIAVSAMLVNLEDARRDLAAEYEKIERAKFLATTKADHIRNQEQKLEKEKANIIREANLAAQKIIDETKEKSKELFIKQQEKLDEKVSADKVWQETQRKLKDWREQLVEDIPEPLFEGEIPSQIKVGDYVYLPRFNQYGNVIDVPNSADEVFVQIGVVKMKAQLSELRHAQPKEKNKSKGQARRSGMGSIALHKAINIEPSLDLHGLDTMEALPILDKYIDDAFVAGLQKVHINHGRGTGALRKFVTEYLHGHRLVKKYRIADSDEGGLGVTIVELDQ